MLAARAWRQFHSSAGTWDHKESTDWSMGKAEGPAGSVGGSEAAWVSTNTTALCGPADLQNPAPIGDRMP